MEENLKNINKGYSICFNEWALDKDIKNELGLLLIISSLTAQEGYCFASNAYFAKLFNTNETTISRKLKLLEAKNYISIEYHKRGTEVISRHVRLSKMITDHYQKCQPTVIKNDKDNNISINNISINNKEKIIKKETKPKISYAEYVLMQEKEYLSLVDKYGETFTRRCIEILNNYKGACGKKYKSDYLAILNWVVARTEQEGIRKEPKVAQKTDKDIEAEIKRLQEKNNSQYLY